ncbi:hypothetical protein PINS_up006720 [Pythium insidiosum]|nr:hypothetical protein PINS_up006720 [Pythium insidiosum]
MQQPVADKSPTVDIVKLSKSPSRRFIKFMHFFIVVTGFAVLGAHSYAVYGPGPSGCVLEVRPWLVRQRACALVEANCHPRIDNNLVNGNAIEFSALFQELETHSLAQITFRHCSQIEFTKDFQRFSHLLGIKLYNSTVASWSADAAIDSKCHTKIMFSYFVRTVFPQQMIPDGLRSRTFPQQLKDIEFCVTNIKTLPEDIHLSWPPLLTLVVEYARLETVPEVVKQLRPLEIGFCGNPIKAVDPWVVMMPDLEALILCNTPITTLPSDGIDASAIAIRTFSLRYSNMTVPPSWMTPQFCKNRRILAGGTPLCRALDNPQENEPLSLSLPEQAALRAAINCVDSKRYYFYPIAYDERAEEMW